MMEFYRDTTKLTPEEVREALLGSEQHRYDPRFTREFGPAAGVFASQLLYLEGKKCWDKEGFVYKSARELEAETGLSRRQQEKARKILGARGVLYEKDAKGPDGRQRKFYKLDLLALLEIVAPAEEESRCTKYSNTVIGISDRGTRSVIPDGDSARYSERSKQESTQEIVSDGYAGRNVPSSPANTDPQQQRGSSKELTGELVRRSRRAGYEPEPRQISAWGRDLAALLAEKPEESYVGSVLTAIEGENRRGFGCSVKQARGIVDGTATQHTPHEANRAPGTPAAGIAALENYEHPRFGYNDLKSFTGIAARYDLTSDEEPPWWLLKQISGNEVEARDTLTRLKTIVERGVKAAEENGEAREAVA